MVSDSQDSILALAAGWLAPLFAPVGFGDWRVVTALISGFLAKESVVSSLTVLFGSTAVLQSSLSIAGAAALLVFCLLYTPCVAAIASVKRELGGKWATAMVLGQCVIAWIAAFVNLPNCAVVLGIFRKRYLHREVNTGEAAACKNCYATASSLLSEQMLNQNFKTNENQNDTSGNFSVFS